MEEVPSSQRVALVAGVTGIVGVSLADVLLRENTPGGPWKVYGIARRPKPEWFSDYAAVEYIRCDLLNREETEKKLTALTDVTHLFFVAWASRDTEEENIEANGSMLRNTLDALLPNAKGFQHVCLQTGTKHYLGSQYRWSVYDGETSMRIFDEDMPRLKEMNFYYAQEDILLEAAKQEGGHLTWSVHRAGIIFGVSPNAIVNASLALAAYACICKYDGSPFAFPGTQRSWESHVEASDAELIAEQEIWAATSDSGKNEAFNIANGDSISWMSLWPAIAGRFGIAADPYTGPKSVVEAMQSKKHVWEDIVREHSLHPTRWEDLMTGWWWVDLALSKLPPYGVSMKKSAKHGFLGSRDTKASLLASIDKMRDMKIIPS